MSRSLFAVGALLKHSAGADEKVSVEMIEASSPMEALGVFFHQFMGRGIIVRDYSVKGATCSQRRYRDALTLAV